MVIQILIFVVHDSSASSCARLMRVGPSSLSPRPTSFPHVPIAQRGADWYQEGGPSSILHCQHLFPGQTTDFVFGLSLEYGRIPSKLELRTSPIKLHTFIDCNTFTMHRSFPALPPFTVYEMATKSVLLCRTRDFALVISTSVSLLQQRWWHLS